MCSKTKWHADTRSANLRPSFPRPGRALCMGDADTEESSPGKRTRLFLALPSNFFCHERHMGSHFVLNLSVALSSTCGRHGIGKWRSGVEFGHQLGPGLAPSLPAEHDSTRQVRASTFCCFLPARRHADDARSS